MQTIADPYFNVEINNQGSSQYVADSTLLYSTLLYSTLLESTLLYSTLLYSTLLESTLLASTRLDLYVGVETETRPESGRSVAGLPPIHIFVCICMCVYIYIYIHIHIQCLYIYIYIYRLAHLDTPRHPFQESQPANQESRFPQLSPSLQGQRT